MPVRLTRSPHVFYRRIFADFLAFQADFRLPRIPLNIFADRALTRWTALPPGPASAFRAFSFAKTKACIGIVALNGFSSRLCYIESKSKGVRVASKPPESVNRSGRPAGPAPIL
jgi:hypothetical protein